MFVPIARLLLRRRGHPASRAAELVAVRARLRAERAIAIDADERALAAHVHAAKLAVLAATGAADACGRCARGQPAPVGVHAGGACCANDTAIVIDAHEIAALAHAGTRARDLVAPAVADPHAGCAFRGATGCSLAPVHRPARCVHFACSELRAEVHTRGGRDALEAARATLAAAMRDFTAAHRARLDRAVLAPIVDALERASRR